MKSDHHASSRSLFATRRRVMAYILSSAAICCSTAHAAPKAWNTTSGNWSVAANWSPLGVPLAGDTASITGFASGNVVVTYDYTGAPVALSTVTLDAIHTLGATLNFNMAANNLTAASERIADGGSGQTQSTVAVFNQSGGTNTLSGLMFVGFNPSDQGTYNLSGTGILNAATGSEIIGNSGQGSFNESGGSNSTSAFTLGNIAASTGAYSLTGGTLTTSATELVGSHGTGTFMHSAGSNSVGTTLTLGDSSGASGDYSLSGTGILTAHDETVGNIGAGTFEQASGSNTVAGVLTLAKGSGTTASYTQTGGTLKTGNDVIGDLGTATITQSAGSHTTTNFIQLGGSASGSGTYNLSGTGTVNAGVIVVGANGTGAFNQTGGSVNSGGTSLEVGASPGSHGTYMLSGGSLTTSGESIGENGQGNFIQSGGTNQTTGDINLGIFAGVGTYTLSGGTLTSGGTTINSGSFTQTGGNYSVNPSGGFIRILPETAPASYSLSGNGTIFASGFESVSTSGAANATFTQSGGTNQMSSDLSVSSEAGVSGTSSYSISAGVVYIGDALSVGDGGGTGQFTQTGGIVELFNNSPGNATRAEHIGANAGAVGTFNQSGGTQFIGDSRFGIYEIRLGEVAGATGTYNLSGSGQLEIFGNEFVGQGGTGTFNQTSGSNHIFNMENVSAGDLRIGEKPGSNGTYTLSGQSVLTVASREFVGNSGVGHFTQTGGSHTVGSDLTIGGDQIVSAGTGTFTLSGGTLTVAGNTSVGTGDSGHGIGNGTLSISGGAVMTSNGVFVNGDIAATSLTLNAATLNTPTLFFKDLSQFRWTSGTLNLTAPQQSDFWVTDNVFGMTATLASGQTLMATGDSETLGGTQPFSLTLSSGSTHYVSGTLNLNAGASLTQNAGSTFFASKFVMAGGTVGGTLTNQGEFHYQSGLFNGRLINQGTIVIEAPSMTLGNGLENDADITLDAVHTLVANGAGLDNFGTMTLGGATLSGTGPVVNDFGGQMTAHGTINPSFTNNGRLTVDGTLRFSSSAINSGILDGSGALLGAFLNTGSGTVDLAAGNALSIATSWTNSGIVVLRDATSSLAGGAITNAGTIQGVGTVLAPVSNTTGIVRAGNGELHLAGAGSGNTGGQIQAPLGGTVIYLQGLASNSGTIALTGGTFDNNAHAMANFGAISGHGTLRTGGLTIGGGSALLAVGGGDMDILGTVTNNGTVNIQGGRTAYFYGNVNGAGAYTGAGTVDYLATFSPGNSPASVSFAGNVTLGGATSLAIEIGGATPGAAFDQVHVAGQLSLGGTLVVSLINSFAPTVGSSFDILDWGTLSGIFSNIQLPTLAGGLAWDASQLYTTGALSVVAAVGLPGDFNHNGVVDAADYVAWRHGLGTTFTQTDYDVWRTHFGQTAASGSAATANVAVPEPTPSLLLIGAILGLYSRARSAAVSRGYVIAW